MAVPPYNIPPSLPLLLPGFRKGQIEFTDMFLGGPVAVEAENKVDYPDRQKNPANNPHDEIIEKLNKGNPGHEQSQRGSDIGQNGAFIGQNGSGGIELIVNRRGAVGFSELDSINHSLSLSIISNHFAIKTITIKNRFCFKKMEYQCRPN